MIVVGKILMITPASRIVVSPDQVSCDLGGEAAMLGKISFGTNATVRDVPAATGHVATNGDLSAIDDNALSLIREKRAPLHETAESLAKAIDSFRATLAADTMQNESVLRPQIHQLFVSNPGMTFAALNESVYSDVFKTPREDPWLGLRSDQAFTAIAAEGVEQRRDQSRPN